MSPRNYFFQSQNNPYFQSHEYKQTDGYKMEKKIEGLFDKFITIPRRFLRGIKNILWSK